jgi:hypothetical protein
MPSRRTIAVTLTCSLAAVGCSDRAADSAQLVAGLIQAQQLYSAYDGEHEYRVVARVDRTVADLSFLHWTTDSAFVERLWDPGVPGAVLLRTKRTGTTHLELLAETTDGERIRGEATLEISPASSDEWARGDEYWSRPRSSRTSCRSRSARCADCRRTRFKTRVVSTVTMTLHCGVLSALTSTPRLTRTNA